MNDLLSRPYILILLSVTALIAAIIFVADIPDIITKNSAGKSNSDRITNESFDIIDQALKEKVSQDFYTFVGDFENPFRKGAGGSIEPSRSSVSKPVAIERTKLQLKGILSNNKPLAILEDERGESYIRGVGDSVANQLVSAINGSSVTITDSKGKYEITVAEE